MINRIKFGECVINRVQPKNGSNFEVYNLLSLEPTLLMGVFQARSQFSFPETKEKPVAAGSPSDGYL